MKPNGVRRLDDVDWATWEATDPATLVFVVRGSEVLLIRKKRGLGAGKINAPGGRREPGESSEECAIREVQEELGVTPLNLQWIGENRFQFCDGYSIHVQIFRADDIDGTPIETDEAIPHWFDVAEIPYREMWEDDFLWVQLVLARVQFSGRFVFDGETMLDWALEHGPVGASEDL